MEDQNATDPCVDNGATSTVTTAKNRVRGCTRMARIEEGSSELGVRRHVNLNRSSEAYGENAAQFTSTFAIIVKRSFPLTVKDWRKVPQEDKDSF